MSTESKKTLLHAWHCEHGAKMADFGGYEMPLWYSSVKNEHLAVITNAGLFDTSHMAVVLVDGPEAFDLLQTCFTNDLSACIGPQKKELYPGRCVYGAFLKENGDVIDDAIIFQLAKADYMIVINAGMGASIAAHLNAHAAGKDVVVKDLTDMLGKVDVQGPMAAKIVSKVLAEPDRVFEAMPYFSFKGHFDAASPLADAVRTSDGTPILLSRTGYTGEFGFEIFVNPNMIETLWQTILDAGDEFGITPCGLAARDSLRAGAVLPLSHQDIGNWPFMNHPWLFALPTDGHKTDFTKTFIGSDALRSSENADYTYAFIGNDLRKVSTTDPAQVLDADGRTIGSVLTCATDMALGMVDGKIYSVASPDRPAAFKAKGLSCGFVKVDRELSPGQLLQLKDNRRSIKVRTTEDVRPYRTARVPLKNML
ncbi:MAG: aminomethyl transferase family protein [Desulfobacteraceae bacterium]|nr:aminomethyl transferase family protein [Desulfobacteraceae bacterium]